MSTCTNRIAIEAVERAIEVEIAGATPGSLVRLLYGYLQVVRVELFEGITIKSDLIEIDR